MITKNKLSTGQLALVILLVVALVLSLTTTIVSCMSYDYHYEEIEFYDEVDEEWYTEYVEVGSGDLLFNPPGLFNILYFLQAVAPIVMIILLSLNSQNLRVLLPLTVALLGVYLLLTVIDCRYYLALPYAGNILVLLLTIVFVCLAVFGVAKLPYKKGLIIPFFLLITVLEVLNFFQVWEGNSMLIKEGLALYAIYPITNLLTYLLIYAAVLLFVFKVDKPQINVATLPADQALRMLNESFVKGQISMEEYQARRAEIINKL